MAEFKCPFCGSDKRLIPTGFVKNSTKQFGEYEEEVAFCCEGQKQNEKYAKRYDPDNRPDPDEISEL